MLVIVQSCTKSLSSLELVMATRQVKSDLEVAKEALARCRPLREDAFRGGEPILVERVTGAPGGRLSTASRA